MRLTGIQWYGYSLPFRQRYITASSQAISRAGLILFLQTDSGITGTGEASPVGPSSPEEVEEVASDLARTAPGLLERELDIENMSIADASPAVRFGLETALLDIRGQELGQPICQMLGGSPRSLRVNALISTGSPQQAAHEAREFAAGGFTCLKLKIGQGNLEQDEALVSAVRQAAGPQMKLSIDPNQAWSTAQAIESLNRLNRYHIEYVEQPVAAEDIPGMAEVRRSSPIAIAADESLKTEDDLQAILAAGAADIFILKAARLGGLRTVLRIARKALEAGAGVVLTSSLESGIGVAAGAHLASVLPLFPPEQGLATGILLQGDLVSPALLPSAGYLAVRSSPGLGVKVSPVLLEKYRTEIYGTSGSLKATLD